MITNVLSEFGWISDRISRSRLSEFSSFALVDAQQNESYCLYINSDSVRVI